MRNAASSASVRQADWQKEKAENGGKASELGEDAAEGEAEAEEAG